MRFRKHVDVSLLAQSLPSLGIAVVGLVMSGKTLDAEQRRAYAQTFPLLLLANCMLTFKGNVELIFALQLAAAARRVPKARLLGFAGTNACVVLAQALVIGVALGVLGAARNVARGAVDAADTARLAVACVGACAASSALVVCLLVPGVLLAAWVGCDPDSVVLPLAAAAGDVLGVACLARALSAASDLSGKSATWGLVALLVPLPLLCAFGGRAGIPLQPPRVAALSYTLSAVASVAVQHLAPSQLLLAASTPIFCGISGAVAYVYLGRRIATLHRAAPSDMYRARVTLLTAAVLLGMISTLMMPALGIAAHLPFGVLFVVGLLLSVAIMLRVVETIVGWLASDVANAGVASVPIVTSAADFIGTFIVISTSLAVHGK